ncbi:MAG: 2-dehydropantoate 2-reductase N-terminal domain-containing protein, partial [Clostridia bacterium]
MKIVVLGSGGWGTALAVMLAGDKYDVTLWSFLEDEYARLSADRENKQFLAGVAFPESLSLTCDMSVAADADMIVMATPSFAVAGTARALADIIKPGTIVVNVSKGIDGKTGKRLSEVVEDELHGSAQVVVLSGPSHAEEVGRGVPTTVVAASKSKSAAVAVQDVFMNDRFRVYITPDVIGVELGAALKNVVALCAGICDG